MKLKSNDESTTSVRLQCQQGLATFCGFPGIEGHGADACAKQVKALVARFAHNPDSVSLDECEQVAIWKHLLKVNEVFMLTRLSSELGKRNMDALGLDSSFQLAVAETPTTPKKKPVSKAAIMEKKAARAAALQDSEQHMIAGLMAP